MFQLRLQSRGSSGGRSWPQVSLRLGLSSHLLSAPGPCRLPLNLFAQTLPQRIRRQTFATALRGGAQSHPAPAAPNPSFSVSASWSPDTSWFPATSSPGATSPPSLSTSPLHPRCLDPPPLAGALQPSVFPLPLFLHRSSPPTPKPGHGLQGPASIPLILSAPGSSNCRYRTGCRAGLG